METVQAMVEAIDKLVKGERIGFFEANQYISAIQKIEKDLQELTQRRATDQQLAKESKKK